MQAMEVGRSLQPSIVDQLTVGKLRKFIGRRLLPASTVVRRPVVVQWVKYVPEQGGLRKEEIM